MVQPKPIELTQVNAEDYDGSQEPQPFVVVGPIPGTAGSSVQSIVAGTNVTVDDSDPQNPIVSATGGGGGAVDSVNGQTGVVVLDIPETPEDIGAATAAQGTLASTAVQPAALSSYVPAARTVAGKALSANVTLVKADVGLGNVDNTSDANKPVSTAQAAFVDAQIQLIDYPVDSVAGRQGAVVLTSADVGLDNVNNTSDASKPVSTATQTALNAKVNTVDVAGLNTVGWNRAVYIPKNGTVPGGTPVYTTIIEVE